MNNSMLWPLNLLNYPASFLLPSNGCSLLHWLLYIFCLLSSEGSAMTTFSIQLIITLLRSSRPEVFCKKGVPRNFAKFRGKHLCQSLFFNKVAGVLELYLKNPMAQEVFSCEFYKISKNTFLQRTPLVAASVWFVIKNSNHEMFRIMT